MTDIVRPYYQATVSKTIFYPEDADPDDCGLDDYKRSEVEAVRDFIHSESNLLVVGGISGAGKSHLLRCVIAPTASFDFYDLQNLGRSPLREAGCADVAKCVRDMVTHVDERPEGMIPKGIILDEGPVLAKEETSDNLRAVIDELLNMYPKVIIAGGDSKFTGAEQIEIITGCMPADAKIENLIVLIQTLNPKQGAELLVQRSKQIGRNLGPELARAISESVMPYFRMPRVLHSLHCYPDCTGEYKVHGSGIIRSGIMPDEVYDPLWLQQVGIWEERGLRGAR
jgi:hypothetical protein